MRKKSCNSFIQSSVKIKSRVMTEKSTSLVMTSSRKTSPGISNIQKSLSLVRTRVLCSFAYLAISLRIRNNSNNYLSQSIPQNSIIS